MLIECPSCRARAQLPSTKEGAKVRCGECGRVYVARPPGARSPKRSSTSALIMGFGGALAVLIVVVIVYRLGGAEEEKPARAATKAAPEAPPTDDFGWDAETVQLAVSIHTAAAVPDKDRLKSLLYGPRVWAGELAAAAEEEGTGARVPTPEEFLLLPRHEQEDHYTRWVDDLVSGAGRDLVADWRPYDGDVIELSDDEALVRLAVSPRSEGVEKRSVDWKLYRDGLQWKAYHWERWFSPEELARMRKRDRGYEKVELSDGSVVFERETETLGHLEDTPPEVRQRIDELYATMIDLDLTKEAAAAQRELVEIGKPAIPILLTGLYETPLDSEDNAKKCNLIVQTLRDITGEYMGFKPMTLIGSGIGTTEERRQSAIKQWFAWWHRKQDRFEKKEAEDGLEGLIELTDKEKAWLERNKD